METHRRGSDGRRFFTAQFKQEQIARVDRQELTLSELARELAVSPSVEGELGRGRLEPRGRAGQRATGSAAAHS